MSKVSISFKVDPELAAEMREMAAEAECDPADLIRRSLALMKVALSAKLTGQHLGLVRDRSKLDTVITGIITDPAQQST